MDREPYNFDPRFLLTVFIFSLVATIWILINTFFFTPYSIDQTASAGDSSTSIKVGSSIKTKKSTKVYTTAKDKNSIGKQKKGSVGIALEGPVNKDFWKIDFETGIDGYVEKDHISYYYDPTRDTTPPTLTMLSPKGNISVSGTVHFKLDVKDDRGIDHVDFIIDRVIVKTLTTAPYEIYVGGADPEAVQIVRGKHKFGAVAVDTSGNVTTIDPEVTITFPTLVSEGGVNYLKFTFAIVPQYSYIIEKTISLTSPINWIDVNTLPVTERGRAIDNSDGTLSYLAPLVGQMGFFRVKANSVPIPTYSMTVTKAGTGQGVVNSITPDNRINCGTTCTGSYIENQSVTLRAVANIGSTFSGWIGACLGTGDCVVFMNSIKNVTANFTLIPTDPTQRPPWQNFDLSKWKIQVTAKQTSPTEYFPSQFDVNASAFSTWFRTDTTDGSMLFWLDSYKNPASGTYLRSELREVIDGSTSYTNWNPLVGTHTLRANMKVKQISGMPTQITVLQIHPYDPINPLLRVAWYLNSSNPGQSYIKAHYKTDATGDANASVTCSNPVGLNRFDAEVIVQNQQLILNINGTRCLAYNIPFWNHEGYFKAGDYAQAYSGTSQVNFYRLEASHTP